MSDTIRIRLRPLGTDIEAPPGARLQDLLFSHGVEFPCGGHGRCKGCRVRVLEGSLPVTPAQEKMLSTEELEAGWRLSCQCRADGDLTLEMAHWEAQILADTANFVFTPRSGTGIAIDVGSTTIVAQLLDLQNGEVLAVRTALNAQARFGADIMSRVGVGTDPTVRTRLATAVRKQIGKMVDALLEASGPEPRPVAEIILVGNTVMHHLFCDIDVTPLSHVPFESHELGSRSFTGSELGWEVPGGPAVRFLPNIGGFVGSDVLAGILATHMHESELPTVLVDLGTNGEIVVGNRERLLCASTAAGPAFEGARIYMGMRASTGAVASVDVHEGALVCHVLGDVPPRGICGSGLVDAVAGALDLGLIQPSGRLSDKSHKLELCYPVRISQTDIRELQLAKGAVASGIHLLLREFGIPGEDVHTVLLAGAFGNYINISSARRIGLLPFPVGKIEPTGNTALRGAKMGLFLPPGAFDALASRITHVSLGELEGFQDTYVEEMVFPAEAPEADSESTDG